jgi:hypothetical protein
MDGPKRFIEVEEGAEAPELHPQPKPATVVVLADGEHKYVAGRVGPFELSAQRIELSNEMQRLRDHMQAPLEALIGQPIRGAEDMVRWRQYIEDAIPRAFGVPRALLTGDTLSVSYEMSVTTDGQTIRESTRTEPPPAAPSPMFVLGSDRPVYPEGTQGRVGTEAFPRQSVWGRIKDSVITFFGAERTRP